MALNKNIAAIVSQPKLLVSALLIAASPAAVAQNQTESHSLTLEEVIVTAQKREQNSMDVPITIDTFSPQDIQATGALSIIDIHRYIPGLDVGEGQLTQAGISIRGISSANISTGGDPSVATFFDGSYIPRAATTVSFSDIQRIEVLKGPQGTLFGRNAAAGVINIVPNAPGEGDYGFVKLKVGNQSLRRVEGMANLTLSDNVFLRVNALSNERDGFINNTGTGGDPGAQDNSALRAALRWQLSDDSELLLSYDWDKIDQAAPHSIGIGPFALNTNPFSSTVANDVVNGGEARDMQAFGVKFNHEINGQWSMKALASYREFETRNRTDGDGTADISRYIDTDNIEDSDIFYSELQLNFSNDFVTVVSGLNYSQEDIYQAIPTTLSTDSLMSFQAGPAVLNLGGASLWDPNVWAAFSSQFTGGVPLDQSQASYTLVNQILRAAVDPNIPPHFFAPSTSGDLYNETMFNRGDFENYGIYIDADFELSEKFSLALGLRHSIDKKQFSWHAPLSEYAQANPQLGLHNLFIRQVDPTSASKRWSKTTGRVVANYRLTEDSLVFASYSTGYKSGGFDSLEVATADLPIDPEEVKNVELGFKGDLFNKRLRAQVSYYDIRVDGSQRTIFGQRPQDAGAIYYVINGETDNSGIEMVLDWLVTDTVKLGLSTLYAKNESQFEPYHNTSGELVANELVKQRFDFQDNYTATLDWSPQLSKGELNVHLDYIFTADRLRGTPDFLDSFAAVPGYGADRKRLNARISWTDSEQKYELALWGRNLTDSQFVSNIGGLGINTINTPVANIEQPRTFGLDISYNF
ncbi:TonB-dependent receptor [Pseudoteredinibacter isoporae]|uniref:Iron complex outermembrane receptor protein n=1 Tax=Pseudoteredinibacter isoporae TaxID=570281 RepID=A0A7X0JVL3_9GAMM|nr:TonB-dependent receptor [Pseudoteredinibacter isoporae]MBB6522563.1 iron complex outermembrane receptor protein [Pseudoteredinibacter isoporae]NHO88093.1 TonB-dependent receptor [Pseudoteredinibacter isoporae]NIB23576.1 TonB-dependent receptor [Pseudoteredinibacter isoporae]